MENVQSGADRIVAARQRAAQSQTELAQSLGMSRSYLSRVEHGKCRPSADMLIKIASSLGIDSDVLLADYGYAPPDVVEKLTRRPELSERVRSMV